MGRNLSTLLARHAMHEYQPQACLVSETVFAHNYYLVTCFLEPTIFCCWCHRRSYYSTSKVIFKALDILYEDDGNPSNHNTLLFEAIGNSSVCIG